MVSISREVLTAWQQHGTRYLYGTYQFISSLHQSTVADVITAQLLLVSRCCGSAKKKGEETHIYRHNNPFVVRLPTLYWSFFSFHESHPFSYAPPSKSRKLSTPRVGNNLACPWRGSTGLVRMCAGMIFASTSFPF